MRRKDNAPRWLHSRMDTGKISYHSLCTYEVGGVTKLILQATRQISSRLSSGCSQFLDTPFQQLSTCRAIASHTADNSPVMIHLFNKALLMKPKEVASMPIEHPCSALPWQTGRRVDGWNSYRWIDRWMSRSLHLAKDFYGGTICNISHTPRNSGFIRQDSIHSSSTSHIPFPFILSQPRRHTATQEERVTALKQRKSTSSKITPTVHHGRSIFLSTALTQRLLTAPIIRFSTRLSPRNHHQPAMGNL